MYKLNKLQQRQGKPANQMKVYQITKKDLPLSCPTKDRVVWNSHPRVYLPIESTGRVRCPYCSAEFILE